MLQNYIVIAFRHLWSNKLYTGINIIGLAVGLAIYLFAQILADYERSYDTVFANHDRVYVVTEGLSQKAGGSMRETAGSHLAIGPLLDGQANVEKWARAINSDRIIRSADKRFNEFIKFVDPGFFDIFDFEIVAGEGFSMLADPDNILMSETAAQRYFGEADPIGQILTIDNRYDLRVSAVYKDLPINSHFVSSLTDDTAADFVATTQALSNITGWDIAGDFNSTSDRYKTYVMLPQGVTAEMMQPNLDALFDANMPERLLDYYSSFGLIPLTSVNTFLWDATGMPMITTLQILGSLILLVACINYANLATAQVMGRTREVGLRRTMGAGRGQLFFQFITESIILSVIALAVAVSMTDFIIPVLNNLANRNIEFGYFSSLTLFLNLLGVAVFVGCIAGIYPAFIISKGKAVQLLSDEFQRGTKGGKIRSTMIALQFTISVFMVIAVAVIYTQNKKMEESANIFAKDEIIIVENIFRREILERRELLKTEVENIPGVISTSYLQVVPYQQSNINSDYFFSPGDEATKTMLWRLTGDENFIDLFDFEMIAGRQFDIARANDILTRDENGAAAQPFHNVIVNEALVRSMGLEEPTSALGVSFYQSIGSEGANREFRIVGVVKDKNYMGFHNSIKPSYFMRRPENYQRMAIRFDPSMTAQVLDGLTKVWDRVNPELPLERQFLDDWFEDGYEIFRGVTTSLVSFAILALFVAMIGLFGVAALMAQKRTKEIGIRKVLGASINKIVQLLVWQFSKPVLIAILIASPIAYFVTGFYLDFFSERIGVSPFVYIFAGAFAMGLATLTVSIHAIRVARINPIHSLRYE